MENKNRYSIDIQKIILIIAIVTYIIIVICILLSKASATQRTYPQGPIDVCPDFWKDESAGNNLGSQCKNSPDNPMYFNGLKSTYTGNKGDLPHTKISFDANNATLNFTKASDCDKWCFTKKYDISWNGISYGNNNIIDKNCKCYEIVTTEDKEPGNSNDRYGGYIALYFFIALGWILGIGIEYWKHYVANYFLTSNNSAWIEILLIPFAILFVLPAKLAELAIQFGTSLYHNVLSPILMPIYFAIFIIYPIQFVFISYIACIGLFAMMVQLGKANDNAAFLGVFSTLFTISCIIFAKTVLSSHDSLPNFDDFSIEHPVRQNLTIKNVFSIFILSIYIPIRFTISFFFVIFYFLDNIYELIKETLFRVFAFFLVVFLLPVLLIGLYASEKISAALIPIFTIIGIYLFAMQWT